MRKPKAAVLQVLVHIAALLPLLVLIWDFGQDRLTVNPIQEIQLRTGRYALLLLVLSLACTPLSQVSVLKQVSRFRRPLGLYAFTYASLHSLNFVWLDYGFDFSLIRDGIAKNSFALLGLAAFLCLLPVATTSTRGWMKRLGKNWARLHWLVYPAVILSVTHFTLQVKADFRLPLLYWTVLVLLLVARLPGIRRMARRSTTNLRGGE